MCRGSGEKWEAVEERDGKSMVCLFFSENKIPFYQREILKNTCEDIFVPMTFLLKNAGYQIYYDITGLKPLTQHLSDRSLQRIPSFTLFCVQLIQRLIELLWQAEDHLLFLHDFRLSLETVFYKEESGKIRIAFFPVDDQRMSGNLLMLQFLEELECAAGDQQWSEYSHRLRRGLNEQHVGLWGLRRLLEEMEKELVYGG